MRCMLIWRSGAAVSLACVAAVVFARDPLPRATPEEVGMSSERLGRIGSTFQGFIDNGKLAGAVVLIARQGKIAYLQAFGDRDREAHSAMREDSIFRIASQTKALTSVGIMMLQEQGKLLLSDPVGKYIPEFMETTVAVARAGGGYDVVKAKRAITIRDLLTHTSGLSYGEGPAADQWQRAGIQGWYFANRNEPIAATVKRIAKLPLDAQPGEKWIYGYSLDVLGVVIEKVSAKSLDEFFRTMITGPLQMTDTQFYLDKSKRDRLAVVYANDKPGKASRVADGSDPDSQGAYVEGPRKSFSGGAGLLSTAGDYARFLQMLLNGGELDGQRLLGRKDVELMTTDHIGAKAFDEGRGFGLGFEVVKDLGARGIPGSVGEYGWGGAYHSTYWVDPKEQLVVVYLSQVLPAADEEDGDKLRALIYQSIVE